MKDGKKYDQGKPRFDLVDMAHMQEIAKVLAFGAEKYEPDAWRAVPDAEDRYFAALMRHLTAYRQGKFSDPETGLSHLAHAACNIMFLAYFERASVPMTIDITLRERPTKGFFPDDDFMADFGED